jgi:hypothetical protein
MADNDYALHHGNITRGGMYSDTLNALYESSTDSSLRKIPRSTDGNKIVFKQFADWASANPNKFAQTIDAWQTSVPAYLSMMFPEEITQKSNVLQTIIIADPTTPDVTSRKAPNRRVHTSMTRVGTSLRYYGIAFTMDYHLMEVDGKGNSDKWSEFDLNLTAVMQAYIATRIHTIFLTFPSTAQLHGGPKREFAFTELPHDVDSFLRVRNSSFALLSFAEVNGFMEIIRRGNEVFARDKLVVGGILVADSLIGSAMFDKEAKIQYSRAGGNSFIADKDTNPRILPREVTVYEVPYVQKLKHNEFDLHPFRHLIMLGSMAYYDDLYSELRSDEYRSVFRTIFYYDDVSQTRSAHNFVNGLLHSGHFNVFGDMAIGRKLAFLDPRVITEMCEFCGSNKEDIIASNTYDILSQKSISNEMELVPCFTFGELPKDRYPDYIMKRMFDDCCYQLSNRFSIRTDVLGTDRFEDAFAAIVARDNNDFDTSNVAEVGDIGVFVTELLHNVEICQFVNELANIFPWINSDIRLAVGYLFLDQNYILTTALNEILAVDVNIRYDYAYYVHWYNRLVIDDHYSKLANHSLCIGNLRLCERFNEFYQRSIDLRRTSRFQSIVLRALIMTPINRESLMRFEEMDIRIPFGLIDLRPFEQQEIKDAILVASGRLGTAYSSEKKNFVSFSTNDQQLSINNYISMGALITNTDAFQYFRNVKGGARVGGKGDKYINDYWKFDPNRNDGDMTPLHEAIADVRLLGDYCIFAAMTSHADAINSRKPVHVSVDGKFRPDQFSGYADVFPEFSRNSSRPQYEGVFFLNWFFGLHKCQSFKERNVPEFSQLTRNYSCFLESFNKICSQVDSQHYDFDSMDFKREKVSHHAWGRQGAGSFAREKGDF